VRVRVDQPWGEDAGPAADPDSGRITTGQALLGRANCGDALAVDKHGAITHRGCADRQDHVGGVQG